MPLRVIVSFAPTFSYVSSDCSGTAFRTETFASNTCVDRSHAHGESDDTKHKLTCHTTNSSQMMVKSTGFSNSADCSGTGPTEETPFPTGACLSNGHGGFEKWSCDGSTVGMQEFSDSVCAVAQGPANSLSSGSCMDGTKMSCVPNPASAAPFPSVLAPGNDNTKALLIKEYDSGDSSCTGTVRLSVPSSAFRLSLHAFHLFSSSFASYCTI